jgi:hypothetical protein
MLFMKFQYGGFMIDFKDNLGSRLKIRYRLPEHISDGFPPPRERRWDLINWRVP